MAVANMIIGVFDKAGSILRRICWR